MSKQMIVGIALGAAALGFVGGVIADRAMAEPYVHHLSAAHEQGQLRNSIVVLKLLDEGNVAAAKADLERTLNNVLDSAPHTQGKLDDGEMKRNLGRAIDLGHRVRADRTRPLEQLMREVGS